MRSARALLALAVWAAGATAGVAAATPPAGPKAPRIAVQAPVLDLGAVPRGQTVEARFEIANRGDAVLNILEAKPG